MARSTRPPSVGPSDHRQLDVALGAQLGHGLEQGHQALHRDVAARGDHDPARRWAARRRWAGRRCGRRRPARPSCARARPPSAPRCPGGEFCETVTTAGRARATRSCMPRKPNQRRVVKRCQGLVVCDSASWRSTVMGWCSVVSRGHPSSTMPSMPLPRHWLSWTTSNSSRRWASSWRARSEKARGSPKPAVHMMANSIQSSRDVNSLRCGHPEGVGVPVEVEPGHGREADARRRARARAGPRRPRPSGPRATSSRVRWRV